MHLFVSQSWSLAVGLLGHVFLVGLVAAQSTDKSDLFSRLDTDGDGQLNSDEFPDEHAFLHRRLLRTADSNSDGQLSAAEFRQGLTSERAEKPLAEKGSAQLPGSDALLLLLAWMDKNSDLTIKSDEVSANLQLFYHQIQQQLQSKDTSQFRIRQLQQQSPRFTQLALRYTQRQQIDVELELSLLSDSHFAMVERLRGKVEAGQAFSTRENAEALFARLDLDGDGVIEMADLPEGARERFSDMFPRADRDGDQRLTEAEFLSFREQASRQQRQDSTSPQVARRVGQLLRRADRNGDGQLTRRESPRFLAARFQGVDSNDDGRLDREELSHAMANSESLEKTRKLPAYNPSKNTKN